MTNNTAVSVIESNASFLSEVAARVEDMRKAQSDANALIAGIKRMELQHWIETNMSGALVELFGRFAGRPGYFKTTRVEDADTIRAVMTEAFVNGLNPVGEEFMVIHGRLYIHAKGYRRLLKSIGCQVRTRAGAIERKGTRALVEFEVAYTWNGRTETIRYAKGNGIDTRINVKIDRQQDEDAFLGKAERKALRNVWVEVCDQQAVDVDSDDATVAVDVIEQSVESNAMNLSKAIMNAAEEQEPIVDSQSPESDTDRTFAMMVANLENVDMDASDACGSIERIVQRSREMWNVGGLTDEQLTQIEAQARNAYRIAKRESSSEAS